MSVIINLFGGPGVGKSTIAAELFVALRKERISCEYITEYAKDKTWEGSTNVLNNQLYVFGKQHHKMFIVNDKVDVLVCDSPLILSPIYGGYSFQDTFYKLVIEEHNKFTNINIIINRSTIYDVNGRAQSEEDAILVDKNIIKHLEHFNIEYIEYDINTGIDILKKDVIKHL